ncbi:hypothetical protein FOXYS1_15405, partial [Fusarium oxysporum]
MATLAQPSTRKTPPQAPTRRKSPPALSAADISKSKAPTKRTYRKGERIDGWEVGTDPK